MNKPAENGLSNSLEPVQTMNMSKLGTSPNLDVEQISTQYNVRTNTEQELVQ